MWTPPPTTEIDLVRSELAGYNREEVIMAWYQQTSDGQPFNMMLFFDQYEKHRGIPCQEHPCQHRQPNRLVDRDPHV